MAMSIRRTSLVFLSTPRSAPVVFVARTQDPLSLLLGRRALSFSRPKFNLQHPLGFRRRFSWGALSELISQLRSAVNNKFLLLVALFGNQFNAIAAQRIRRALQILNLYNNLGYDRTMVKNIVERMGAALPKKLRSEPFGILLGAAFFTWEKERISDDELTKVSDEIAHIQRMNRSQNTSVVDSESYLTEWEKIIDKGYLMLWRKPIPNSYLYEYKVYGTFHDLPARAFFAVQVDLEFRRQWDKLVISLDVIDREDESGSEVVHWIMHYPYPMYSREYIYVRKYKVDYEKKLMVIVNRSIDHPSRPVNSKYVRVNTYLSNMVIKPHTSFDENGFDYVLTYYDDPKAAFPSVAYNWMANTGVPDFVEKLHTAAQLLHERKTGKHDDELSQDKDRIPM